MKTSIIKNSNIKNKILPLLSVFVLLFLWQIISLIMGKEELFPSPYSVFYKTLFSINQKKFFIIVGNTLLRVIQSFVISFFLSLVLGIISGLNNTVLNILRPIVNIFKSVPTMSVIIIVLMYLSLEIAPIIICFLIIFPIIYNNIVIGILSVDKKLLQMAKVFNFSRKSMLYNIYIPSIKPFIKASINSALGLNFKIMIAAEVIGMPKLSLGEQLYLAKVNIDFSAVFAWTIVIIILSWIFEGLTSRLFKIDEK